jgi:hypothetical protein
LLIGLKCYAKAKVKWFRNRWAGKLALWTVGCKTAYSNVSNLPDLTSVLKLSK